MESHYAHEVPERGCAPFWLDAVAPQPRAREADFRTKLIGILEGEGIGPEVMHAALHVLAAIESVSGLKFELRRGGPIGLECEAGCGQVLSDEVVAFCQDIFSRGGAILSGPGGGRFVYELRRHFDLYCKVSPLKPCRELCRAGRLQPQHLDGIDILIVRDNIAGVYQGQWREVGSPSNGRVVEHTFSYTEKQVRRIMEAAAQVALRRSGRMSVVVKDGGVPGVSRLWRDVASDIAPRHGVTCAFINADHAAYRIIQHPREFDVIVTPNLVGDILADVGAVLLGSRGLSFSGNFAASGHAVYQTNHGSAHDLTGTDRANPVGQIAALAMLLRESFGLLDESAHIERSVAEVWRQGWRTDDLAESGCRLAGTQELADLIALAVVKLSCKETPA